MVSNHCDSRVQWTGDIHLVNLLHCLWVWFEPRSKIKNPKAFLAQTSCWPIQPQRFAHAQVCFCATLAENLKGITRTYQGSLESTHCKVSSFSVYFCHYVLRKSLVKKTNQVTSKSSCVVVDFADTIGLRLLERRWCFAYALYTEWYCVQLRLCRACMQLRDGLSLLIGALSLSVKCNFGDCLLKQCAPKQRRCPWPEIIHRATMLFTCMPGREMNASGKIEKQVVLGVTCVLLSEPNGKKVFFLSLDMFRIVFSLVWKKPFAVLLQSLTFQTSLFLRLWHFSLQNVIDNQMQEQPARWVEVEGCLLPDNDAVFAVSGTLWGITLISLQDAFWNIQCHFLRCLTAELLLLSFLSSSTCGSCEHRAVHLEQGHGNTLSFVNYDAQEGNIKR